MMQEPQVESGEPISYIGKILKVSMPGLSSAASGINEIYRWLSVRRIQSSGPPFYRYLAFQENGWITLEVGVPVNAPVTPEETLSTGQIPGGNYLTLAYTGDYSGLRSATATLLDWAETRGLKFDTQEKEGVSYWTSRLEWYLTDPTQETDPAKWQTKLAILLA
jgi:effector-binding domain-containing protein